VVFLKKKSGKNHQKSKRGKTKKGEEISRNQKKILNGSTWDMIEVEQNFNKLHCKSDTHSSPPIEKKNR